MTLYHFPLCAPVPPTLMAGQFCMRIKVFYTLENLISSALSHLNWTTFGYLGMRLS